MVVLNSTHVTLFQTLHLSCVFFHTGGAAKVHPPHSNQAQLNLVLWTKRRDRPGQWSHASFVFIVNNNQTNSRRLELSISKNTPHGRWGQGPGSVDRRFPAGLPFPVPDILEFVALRDSGNIFQQFSWDFPGVFLENPRTDPGNSHSFLEFSEINYCYLVTKKVILILYH